MKSWQHLLLKHFHPQLIAAIGPFAQLIEQVIQEGDFDEGMDLLLEKVSPSGLSKDHNSSKYYTIFGTV